MTGTEWSEVLAVIIGAVVTVIWRLIDRYLPDPDGKHPLPPAPGDSNAQPPDVPPGATSRAR